MRECGREIKFTVSIRLNQCISGTPKLQQHLKMLVARFQGAAVGPPQFLSPFLKVGCHQVLEDRRPVTDPLFTSSTRPVSRVQYFQFRSILLSPPFHFALSRHANDLPRTNRLFHVTLELHVFQLSVLDRSRIIKIDRARASRLISRFENSRCNDIIPTIENIEKERKKGKKKKRKKKEREIFLYSQLLWKFE